jgi:hypothetical protein
MSNDFCVGDVSYNDAYQYLKFNGFKEICILTGSITYIFEIVDEITMWCCNEFGPIQHERYDKWITSRIFSLTGTNGTEYCKFYGFKYPTSATQFKLRWL